MIFPITRKFTIFTTSNGQRYVGATESVNAKRIAFDIRSEIEYSNKYEALMNCSNSIIKKKNKFDYFGQGVIFPAD